MIQESGCWLSRASSGRLSFKAPSMSFDSEFGLMVEG